MILRPRKKYESNFSLYCETLAHMCIFDFKKILFPKFPPITAKTAVLHGAGKLGNS